MKDTKVMVTNVKTLMNAQNGLIMSAARILLALTTWAVSNVFVTLVSLVISHAEISTNA